MQSDLVSVEPPTDFREEAIKHGWRIGIPTYPVRLVERFEPKLLKHLAIRFGDVERLVDREVLRFLKAFRAEAAFRPKPNDRVEPNAAADKRQEKLQARFS